jgi:drug/metabolite transporter (DMT)-like permease
MVVTMIFRIVFLLFGIFCCATAVIFIKASIEHPVLLSSYRLLVASVILTPIFLRNARKYPSEVVRQHVRAALLPGIILGLHFISWIIGARLTTAANASLIVNLVPVVIPFFLFAMIREKLTRAEFMGTIFALTGMCLLTLADFNLSRTYFWGDVLCFVSMLFFTVYLALGRKNRGLASIWLYLVPLYYIAGIFCFLVALGFVNPIKPYPPREIAFIFALGIIPTVMGHSILNYSMKFLRGQVVSVLNMGQFIFAGILAFFLLRESPDWTFYVASLLIVAGAWLAVNSEPHP